MSGNDAFTFEELDAALAYEPETGKFWWKIKPAKNVYEGAEAGAVKRVRSTATGQDVSYRYVRYKGISMPASRVAWLLTHHEWPVGKVNFLNGDTLDTSAGNLDVPTPALPKAFKNADYQKESREAFPVLWKERHLQQNFGIGMADFADMVAAQNNRCAICGEKETATRDGKLKTLAVDHDHTTGKVRELLCHECNVAIGKMHENPERLRAAAAYVEKHSDAGIVPFVPKAETK